MFRETVQKILICKGEENDNMCLKTKKEKRMIDKLFVEQLSEYETNISFVLYKKKILYFERFTEFTPIIKSLKASD